MKIATPRGGKVHMYRATLNSPARAIVYRVSEGKQQQVDDRTFKTSASMRAFVNGIRRIQ